LFLLVLLFWLLCFVIWSMLFYSHLASFFLSRRRLAPRSTFFPYATLFRSGSAGRAQAELGERPRGPYRQAEMIGLTVRPARPFRSEEHTSELQSRENLVCRLLLEKKKNNHVTAILATACEINPGGEA